VAVGRRRPTLSQAERGVGAVTSGESSRTFAGVSITHQILVSFRKVGTMCFFETDPSSLPSVSPTLLSLWSSRPKVRLVFWMCMTQQLEVVSISPVRRDRRVQKPQVVCIPRKRAPI